MPCRGQHYSITSRRWFAMNDCKSERRKRPTCRAAQAPRAGQKGNQQTTMQKEQRWICSNPGCRSQVVVIVAEGSEGTKPRCSCGSSMKRFYLPPRITLTIVTSLMLLSLGGFLLNDSASRPGPTQLPELLSGAAVVPLGSFLLFSQTRLVLRQVALNRIGTRNVVQPSRFRAS